MGGRSCCWPGRRRRCHVADAPPAHQGVLHVGADDRCGEPVGHEPYPRRHRGRRSAVAGLSLALARSFPAHRDPHPVGRNPGIRDLVCARVGTPRGHGRRAPGWGSRGTRRFRKRHHDRTSARLRRRPVLGLRCSADRCFFGPRGTARSDALVTGPRVVARGAHWCHHDAPVPGPHHAPADLRLRVAQGQARRLLRHPHPPAGPRPVDGRGDGCCSHPGHRRERDGQARARHHGLAPPRSGDPQRRPVRHHVVGAPLLHDSRGALHDLDPGAALAAPHGRLRGRGPRPWVPHERLLRPPRGPQFRRRPNRHRLCVSPADPPRLHPRVAPHGDGFDLRTVPGSDDSLCRGARPVGSPRRLGRHPRDHPERAARSAPYPTVLAAREPHAAPARPRSRHPRMDADLGGQPGVGLPYRRGRGRLPRIGRRRADGHRPGVRAGQGLRGDRTVLVLRVRLGPDPRALLGPRGARSGRARGWVDNHAGRRGVPA